MAKQLFGTDGIRGVAGEFPLDPPAVYATGLALAAHLRTGDAAPEVLIGMDTRASGPDLVRLLAAGLEAGGAGVRFGGVIPTPAVAFLTRARSLAGGIVVSASHNRFSDNGIKIFSGRGSKLPDAEEQELERAIFSRLESGIQPARVALEPDAALAAEYLDYLRGVVPAKPAYKRLRVVADCAHGAAWELAPAMLDQLGVRAEIMANHPDGRNINHDCGSLHMDALSQAVRETGADLGVAFDGDADRALFVADDGSIIDGDVILLLAAKYLAARHRLANHLVVTTVMANMGLEKSLRAAGIAMARTQVGDKYVLEEMTRRGASLGGEPSGHIIFRDHASTGDGLLTAAMMIEMLAACGKPLSALHRQFGVFPQVLRNIRIKRKPPLDQIAGIREAIARSERELAEAGRVLVRYSGTEPLVRVMVEAETAALVKRHADRLVSVVEQELG